MRRWALPMAVLLIVLAGIHGGRAEETTLIFATGNPPGSHIDTEFIQPWAAQINEQGKGVLRLDVREGMAVVNIFNAYDRVMSDVVQISFTLFNYVNGKIKTAPVAALPFVDNATDGSVALWRLYKTGALDSDFDQVVPLVLFSVAQSQLHMAKALKDPFDWGGAKIVTPTKIMVDAAQLFNGTPLSLGSPQIYEAIQRGTAAGAVVGWTAFPTFTIDEVTFWHVDEPLGTAAGMLFMARAKYKAMPEAAREILDANANEAASRGFGAYWDAENARAIAAVKASPKQTVITLSAEDRAKWQAKLAPAIDTWTKGVPDGDKVVAQYKALLAQAGAEHLR
jgi:TRAP-type transport system periplasmic protein